MSVSSGDFLRIRPRKLKFPFQLRTPDVAYLHLTNKTDENIAFRILTTNWKLFFTNPSRGIIPPRTTFRLTVVMDAQKEAPQDMLCVDTFLVQSFIAPKDATEKDITSEMFENESGKVVKEFVLGGTYVPVKSPVPEVYQEFYLLDAITGGDAQRNPHYTGLRRWHIHRIQRI